MSGRYIEAPHRYNPAPGDGPTVFLAGGITACPDWQAEAREMLAGHRLVLLNPRRANFDMGSGDSAAEQVAWEHRHLHLADVTLFWFPACNPQLTVQPIVLFELGVAIAEHQAHGRRFVVGRDPAYPRRLDVELQLANALPDHVLHETLPATVQVAVGEADHRRRLTSGSLEQ